MLFPTEEAKKSYVFPIIKDYLDHKQQESELIWTRLMTSRKNSHSNNIYGRKTYLQEAFSLPTSLHSSLYPVWQDTISDDNSRLCTFAFKLLNSFLNCDLKVCSRVPVCETDKQTMCFEHKIQFKYDSDFDSINQDYRNLNIVAAWLHELGHWIEFHNPEVRAMCNAFYEYRTRNSKIKPMLSHPDDKGCFKKDGNFPCEYCGKWYGDWTDARCTEILSQGLELLFIDSYNYLKNDHEYLSFMISILKGDIIKF